MSESWMPKLQEIAVALRHRIHAGSDSLAEAAMGAMYSELDALIRRAAAKRALEELERTQCEASVGIGNGFLCRQGPTALCRRCARVAALKAEIGGHDA